MTTNKGIPIKNVYYMLTYAFKELKRSHYERIAGEKFENIHDLFAEILRLGISFLLKQGLHREYVSETNALSTLRGKLNLRQSILEQLIQRRRLVCEYDEFSENSLHNQILKTAVLLLINHGEVKKERKSALRKLILFFSDIEPVAPESIRWRSLRYDRNTRTYEMLHNLCYFLLQGKLLSTDDGEKELQQFSDEHMNLLFQNFVMAFYRCHFPEYKAKAKQIKWDMSANTSMAVNMLPIMQTDITLTIGKRTLIIDTKYYSKTTQKYQGRQTIHSPNLYQIHTYVMNEDIHHIGNVDGMLLYARTSDAVQPDTQFTNHDGNIFMVRTLDLAQDFKMIESQLKDLLHYS